MYGKDRIWSRIHHSSCLWGRSGGNGQGLKERDWNLRQVVWVPSLVGIPTSSVDQKKKKEDLQHYVMYFSSVTCTHLNVC